MSIRARISMIALLAFGLVVGNMAPASAHFVVSKGFYHFPGDHSPQNGYSGASLDERCVEIDSYMEHGNGYGKSTIVWSTTENVGQYVHCEYGGTDFGFGTGYDWAAIKLWKTDVFATVVLKKQGYSGECDARSQYRSQVKQGEWSWNWTASNISYCGGSGYYYTWSEIQAYDPSIWPGGWSPPVHHNSPVHYLKTTAEPSVF
jgi:hypothetical protein